MFYIISATNDDRKITVKEMTADEWDELMEMHERVGKGINAPAPADPAKYVTFYD